MSELTLLDLALLLGNSFIFPFGLIVGIYVIFSRCSWPKEHAWISQTLAIALIAISVLLGTELVIFFSSPGAATIAAVMVWSQLLVSVCLVLALFLGQSRGPKFLLVSVRIVALLLCLLLIARHLPFLANVNFSDGNTIALQSLLEQTPSLAAL